MTIVEKAAYLKGLTEGLGVDPQSKEGKLWAALNELLADINKRDYNDSHRAEAPCVPADDAVVIDNSNITIEENVEIIALLYEMRK